MFLISSRWNGLFYCQIQRINNIYLLFVLFDFSLFSNVRHSMKFHVINFFLFLNENRKTKRENVNERKENGWIYWKIIGMTSVCFYSGEQKENVSLLFHGVWNELFKWISQLCHFQKLNCDIHMLKVKWMSLSSLSLCSSDCHCNRIPLKDVFCFRNWISEVVVKWVTWDENERRENLKEKQENRFWKSSCPFRGRAFLQKKTKTTRDNRQASSFLIPHLNAWPEARGGFGSAADVCCLVRSQIDWI